jgi:hypothetical protein
MHVAAVLPRLICATTFVSGVCTHFLGYSSIIYDCVHHGPVDHAQICRRLWDRGRRLSQSLVRLSNLCYVGCYRLNFVS